MKAPNVKISAQNQQMLIVFFMIIIVAGLAYYIYKNNLLPPAAIKLPVDLNTQDVNTGYFDPVPFTDALYNDIYASWYTARNADAYTNALNLSNAELAAVDNDWNARYFKKDNETLVTALQGEKTSFTSWMLPTIWDALIARLQTIEQVAL